MGYKRSRKIMPKDLNRPFIQRLYDSNTLDEKFSTLEYEVKNAGFDAALYTFIPKLSRLNESLQPVFQFSSAFTDIVNYYHENDLSRNDFTIRLIEEGKLEIIDWWREAESLELSKEEHHVSQTIREKFRVTKGYSFPTLSNDMGTAAVSIISFKQKHYRKDCDPKLLTRLKHCCKHYHDHTMIHHDARYEFILPILESLTEKKKTVLKYLISGKPMKGISEEADITTRYAEKLLVELRKDFGDISKNELIYYLGLLNINEYL